MVTDGSVSFEEYERSALDYVACLESAGFEVEATLRFRGRYYDIVARSAEIPVQAMQDDWNTCAAQFSLILDIWSLQNQPSEEELQAARMALAECLRERGLEISDKPTPEELGSLARSGRPGVAQCSVDVAETFGLPGFAG